MTKCSRCENKLTPSQKCCQVCGAWCSSNFINKHKRRLEEVAKKRDDDKKRIKKN